jgi:hypothetical protein
MELCLLFLPHHTVSLLEHAPNASHPPGQAIDLRNLSKLACLNHITQVSERSEGGHESLENTFGQVRDCDSALRCSHIKRYDEPVVIGNVAWWGRCHHESPRRTLYKKWSAVRVGIGSWGIVRLGQGFGLANLPL